DEVVPVDGPVGYGVHLHASVTERDGHRLDEVNRGFARQPAGLVHDDDVEGAVVGVGEEPGQTGPLRVVAAEPLVAVAVRVDEGVTAACRVRLDLGALPLDRINLLVGGHPVVGRGTFHLALHRATTCRK